MRIQLLLALAIAWSTTGCDMLQPDESSTSDGTGGADGGPKTTCDSQQQGCAACAQCAGQSVCVQLLSACTNDASCVGLDQCFTLCGADIECKQQCQLANPVGVPAYDGMTRCLYCDQCPKSCVGYRPCGK